MELRDVETFLVLAGELHFGRTAEQLLVSPSRVSQTIRALEHEIGAPLFVRTSRRVALTPLGEAFAATVGRSYNDLVAAIRDARAAARGYAQTLRVGYPVAAGPELPLRVITAFEAAYPECEVRANAIANGLQMGELLRGEIDVMLLYFPNPTAKVSLLGRQDLEIGAPMRTEPRAVWVPVGHPLAGEAQVSIEQVAEYEVLAPPQLSSGPAFHEAWLPSETPSGRPIRRRHDGWFAQMSAVIQDVQTAVARGLGLYLSIESLLDRQPHPGLCSVVIHDMPEAALIPVWFASTGNGVVREFAAMAAKIPAGHENRR